MPTDLTPAEKDDRQVERLIDKTPVPSRKPAGRGAPKHDNRRRRMEDPNEEKEVDKDLTRGAQASLFLIAARVSAKPVKEEDIHKKKALPVDEARALIAEILQKMGTQSQKLTDLFQQYVKKRYEPILFSKTPDKDLQGKMVKGLQQRLSILDKVSNTRLTGSPANIAAKIAELWPSGKPNNWATRAGVIGALQKAIQKTKVPASIKAKMLREPGNAAKDKVLIKQVMEEAKSGNITEDLITDQVELAALTAAYRLLLDNPDSVDAADLIRDMDEVTENVYGEIQQILAIPEFMKTWEKAMGAFSKGHIDTDTPTDTKSSDFYRDVLKSSKSFFNRDQKSAFDPDAFVDGLEDVLGKDFSNAPDELKEMVETLRGVSKGYKSAATSYEGLRSKAMGQRTATYHGVLQQGDPTHGPYTGYRSLDRRYFGKEHYDSIVKTAKGFLKEDWLKYEWEAGAKDANFRAALDLSIHLADSNLYQGKIDVETYNMLLARLMGDKTDVFSETLITNEDSRKSRRAFAMANQHYQALVRIASQLRQENPRAALEIVKNLRSLIAQEQQDDQEQGQEGQQSGPPKQAQQEQECDDEEGMPAAHAPPPPPPPGGAGGGAVGQQQQGQQEQQGQQQMMGQQQQQGQQDQQGQQQQQGQIGDKDMDAFVEGKVDIKDLKGHLKNVVDAQSIEDFVDGLMEMDGLLKKTASGRTAGMMDLEPLEDMDEAQVKQFLDKQKSMAQKLMGENDIEKFMEGLDGIFGEAENAAKSVKTGSVHVSMTTLVRLAHANPNARPVLLAMVIEAAKKKKKKDKRKKDKKDKKGKKPNPFAKGGDKAKEKPKGKGKGGKAPPFGGKKAPPFGKKKSSLDIDPSDSNWS